jgi:hypothetical protein
MQYSYKKTKKKKKRRKKKRAEPWRLCSIVLVGGGVILLIASVPTPSFGRCHRCQYRRRRRCCCCCCHRCHRCCSCCPRRRCSSSSSKCHRRYRRCCSCCGFWRRCCRGCCCPPRRWCCSCCRQHRSRRYCHYHCHILVLGSRVISGVEMERKIGENEPRRKVVVRFVTHWMASQFLLFFSIPNSFADLPLSPRRVNISRATSLGKGEGRCS